MASRFLRVFDRAYEAKKASRKEEIRQQLRARYKERYSSVAAEAKEHLESQTRNLKLDAVQIWLAAASQNKEQRATGQTYAVHHVLSNWRELSEQSAQQDAQSWNMWTPFGHTAPPGLQWPTILETDIGKEVNCSTWGCFPVPSSLRHACGSSRYSYTVDREATGNVEHIGKYHALFQRSRRAVCDLLQVQR
ncbi:hypothetical protein MY8738_009772 [Beauveria namnaoensis]